MCGMCTCACTCNYIYVYARIHAHRNMRKNQIVTPYYHLLEQIGIYVSSRGLAQSLHEHAVVGLNPCAQFTLFFLICFLSC